MFAFIKIRGCVLSICEWMFSVTLQISWLDSVTVVALMKINVSSDYLFKGVFSYSPSILIYYGCLCEIQGYVLSICKWMFSVTLSWILWFALSNCVCLDGHNMIYCVYLYAFFFSYSPHIIGILMNFSHGIVSLLWTWFWRLKLFFMSLTVIFAALFK